MIQPEELRVGNLIRLANNKRVESGCTHEIIDICQSHCRVRLLNTDIDYGQFYKFIKPIKITEDCLRSLDEDLWEFVGFGCRIIYHHSVLVNLKLEYAQGQVYIYFKDEMIGAKDYIHQLQNLFYTLTNEELKLTIK